MIIRAVLGPCRLRPEKLNCLW